MSDNLTLRRPHDAEQISLTQPYEQGWWLTRLGFKLTEAAVLERIINELGTHSAKKVRKWVQKNRNGFVKKWRDEYEMRTH